MLATHKEWTTLAENLETSFTNLNNTPTGENLVIAARNVVELIDKLNIGILKLAKGDITGNIKKVEAANGNLEEIVVDNKKIALGTLWLSRTFSFLAALMSMVVDQKYAQEEPSKLAKIAYEATLKQYHNAATSGVFNLSFKSLPKRSVFEEKIGIKTSEVSAPIHRFNEEVARFSSLVDQCC